MTLEEAVSQFEAQFGTVTEETKAEEPGTILCTGAIGLPDYPPPVLCATEALAVDLWLRNADDYLAEWASDHSVEKASDIALIWLTPPRVQKYKMTLQEVGGGHRIATSRYAVYSLCNLRKQPQDAGAAGIDAVGTG